MVSPHGWSLGLALKIIQWSMRAMSLMAKKRAGWSLDMWRHFSRGLWPSCWLETLYSYVLWVLWSTSINIEVLLKYHTMRRFCSPSWYVCLDFWRDHPWGETTMKLFTSMGPVGSLTVFSGWLSAVWPFLIKWSEPEGKRLSVLWYRCMILITTNGLSL